MIIYLPVRICSPYKVPRLGTDFAVMDVSAGSRDSSPLIQFLFPPSFPLLFNPPNPPRRFPFLRISHNLHRIHLRVRLLTPNETSVNLQEAECSIPG